MRGTRLRPRKTALSQLKQYLMRTLSFARDNTMEMRDARGGERRCRRRASKDQTRDSESGLPDATHHQAYNFSVTGLLHYEECFIPFGSRGAATPAGPLASLRLKYFLLSLLYLCAASEPTASLSAI
jgi:hypothetical protein